MPHRFPDGFPAVLPTTMARVERRLPAPGDIMVTMDSRVEPDDLIGQCSVPGEPVLIDVAGALRIAPREMMRRLRRRPGERLVFRDLLARRRGRSLLAPVTGTIVSADEATGFVVVSADPVPASVSAMLRGTVVAVQPQRAVTIATPAAVVQGAIGFGAEQWGVLRPLVADPGDLITPEMIDARRAFSIILGGAGITAEALRKARHEQVKGIIVGGIDAEELQAFWGERLRMSWRDLLRSGTALPLFDDAPTIVVTEGFGRHPMSRPTFDLLTRFDHQEIHLDGTTRLDVPHRRPRVIIPLPQASGTAPTPQRPLGTGSMVRLLNETHLGAIGRVEAIRERGRLDSGVRMPTYTVVLDDGARVRVPRLAIESVQ
jgi:hypothetical protein